MDDKFRVAFVNPGQTPVGADYFATDWVFDRLVDAVETAQERRYEWALPYIAHKYLVFDPSTIEVLHQQLARSSDTTG